MVYSVILGQCSEGVRAKIESEANHESLQDSGDPIGLLQNIQNVMLNHRTSKYMPHAIHESIRSLYNCVQGEHTDVPDYYKNFKSRLDVVVYNGGAFGVNTGIVDEVLKESNVIPAQATPDEVKDAESKSKERAAAVAFLLGADKKRYGKLVEDLENSFTQGEDRYPKDLTGAYKLMINWKQEHRDVIKMVRAPPNANAEVSFTNVGEEEGTAVTDGSNAGVGGAFTTDGREFPHIRCYNCQQMGHFADQCPNPTVARDRTGNVQMFMQGVSEEDEDDDAYAGFAFTHKGYEGVIPHSWILLDNQSTVNIFHNRELMYGIQTAERWMHIRCNAGVTRTNLMGKVKGFPGEVWYHPNGVANILSLAAVEKHFDVTYDGKNRCFHVHKPDGGVRRFRRSNKGLHYWDTMETEEAVDESRGDAVFFNTVDDKKSEYTVRSYRQAELARKVQNMIGRPSLVDYLKIIDNNMLPNCPVTRDDVLAAEDIFGKNLGSLKGKTVRRKSPVTPTQEELIPTGIKERYTNVTVGMDIMFVNKVAFLVTISHDIKFGTVEHINSRRHDVVLAAVGRVKAVYAMRGFKLKRCHADYELESMRTDMTDMGIALNTTSENEHEPVIERYIRTVKERTRATWNVLPFKKIPVGMVIEIVKGSVMWLNTFPPTGGVSPNMSPRTLVTGRNMDYNKHCRIKCGAYAQTHEDHDNGMGSRTTGAIALRPTGNAQGGYYFLSLTTGRRINRTHWTELPMPAEVIDRVHALARRSKAALGITFAWRDGTKVQDDDEGDLDAAADDEDLDYDPQGGDEEDDQDYYEEEEDDDDNPDGPDEGVVTDNGANVSEEDDDYNGDAPDTGDTFNDTASRMTRQTMATRAEEIPLRNRTMRQRMTLKLSRKQKCHRT
jgi:hypothetical protein